MSELTTTPASTLTAAQQLGEVTRIPAGCRVHLPSAFARDTVVCFLDWYQFKGRVVEGPRPADGIPALGADDWALLVPARGRAPLILEGARRLASRDGGLFLCRVLPRHVVEVPRYAVRTLLAALEHVKPEELDAEGRPLPWVSPRQRPREEARPAEDDVEVGSGPGPAPGSFDGPAELKTEIHERWEKLCVVAGMEPPPLRIAAGSANRCGFVTGRIFVSREGVPLSVGIVLCPNADMAEILATLTHELGHAVARERGHGEAFRQAILDLAGRAFGAINFAGAREVAAGSSRILDQWIASGIRASLQGREPPWPRTADEAQLARTIRRIGKLRALAADQVGRPEAVAATGQANDLVVAYGLQDYNVAADTVVPDEMLDRWLLAGGNAVWRRRLADAVAWWFDVLSLSVKDRIHLFGRHADLVATEYVFGACAERIERASRDHIARWKQQRKRPPGASKRERVSFCDSAVEAFRQKLEAMRRSESPSTAGVPTEALVRAEAFARAGHDRRGLGWSSSSERYYRSNDAGAELGRSLSVARGVEGGAGGGARKLLDGGGSTG